VSINTSQCRPSVPPEQFESEYERIFGKRKPQDLEFSGEPQALEELRAELEGE
jgi:hypothetical protein